MLRDPVASRSSRADDDTRSACGAIGLAATDLGDETQSGRRLAARSASRVNPPPMDRTRVGSRKPHDEQDERDHRDERDRDRHDRPADASNRSFRLDFGIDGHGSRVPTSAAASRLVVLTMAMAMVQQGGLGSIDPGAPCFEQRRCRRRTVIRAVSGSSERGITGCTRSLENPGLVAPASDPTLAG